MCPGLKDRPDYAKKAAIYMGHRYSGLPLKEIGGQFWIVESAVSQASRRFESVLSKNGHLRKEVEKMRKALNLSNVYGLTLLFITT